MEHGTRPIEKEGIMVPILEPDAPHPSLGISDRERVVHIRLTKRRFASRSHKELAHPAGRKRPLPSDRDVFTEPVFLQRFLVPKAGVLDKREREPVLLR